MSTIKKQYQFSREQITGDRNLAQNRLQSEPKQSDYLNSEKFLPAGRQGLKNVICRSGKFAWGLG